MAGATKAELRVCRTADGHLVREDDPRSAFLAYAVGDQVADGDLDAYRDLVDGKSRRQAGTKATAKPADKATTKPEDK
ncbi:hypothetical protein [Micromonospora sp. CB01531]|uniref:hypothetical protein n=1 Tax=Micromonospora sp. CB01531 TaxID=1718947 RepID=UPI00093BB718|nr:hypothetical protein [Micromonospora sp. CB01531]OKI47303.1 hypothetical protein A6A27_10675 [Micromonospora sp. CB01531]